MTNYSNITLNQRQLENVERRVVARFTGVQPYTRTENLPATPGGLIVPLTRSQFRALSQTERELHVLRNIRAQTIEAMKARIAARIFPPSPGTTTPSPASAPTPSDDGEPGATPQAGTDGGIRHRAFVPCMGCGTLIPCRPGRPVLRACSPAPVYMATTRRPGARQINADGKPAKQRARRRRAVCGVTAAPREQREPQHS